MPQFPPEIEELYEELRRLQEREMAIREEIHAWFTGVSQTLQALGLERAEDASRAAPEPMPEEAEAAETLRANLTGHESQRQMILATLAATGRGMRAAEINEVLTQAGLDEIPEPNIRALLSKSSKEGVVQSERHGVYKIGAAGEDYGQHFGSDSLPLEC